MADILLGKHGTAIKELTLIPGGGGIFDVTLNDKQIYSKHETGQFPTHEQILSAIS